MSDPIQFPGAPRGKNAYLDENGSNPFSERQAEVQAGENLFAAPAAGEAAPYDPHYLTTLPHRKEIVFLFGLTSLLAIIVIVGGSLIQPLVALLAPFIFALSIPGWMMGYGDLRAMRSGAMDASGKRLTRAGIVMSILSTLTAVVFLVVQLARLLT